MLVEVTLGDKHFAALEADGGVGGANAFRLQ